MRRSTAAREVFVDTSGLYALIDSSDGYHRSARDRVVAIVKGGQRLVVTDYIVSEAVTLARMRSGFQVAARVLDLLEQSSGIRIEWIGQSRFDAAKAFFRKYRDHAYSFTDCTSFIVMRELRLKAALTSDRHFIEAGFDALLVSD